MNTTKQQRQHRRIRALMMENGVTLKSIAAQEHVTENYVTFVVTGRRVGHRVRTAIARACGVEVESLWPPNDDDDDLPAAA